MEAAQNLQKQLSLGKDLWWLAFALTDEADILLVLGDNQKAFEQYRQSQSLLRQP